MLTFEVAYEEAIDQAKKLFYGPKAHDYNQSGVSVTTYAMFSGPKHWWEMVWQKVLRLRSLLWSGAKPKCEAVEDTCIDLINYAAFCYAQIQLEKKETDNDPTGD